MYVEVHPNSSEQSSEKSGIFENYFSQFQNGLFLVYMLNADMFVRVHGRVEGRNVKMYPQLNSAWAA